MILSLISIDLESRKSYEWAVWFEFWSSGFVVQSTGYSIAFGDQVFIGGAVMTDKHPKHPYHTDECESSWLKQVIVPVSLWPDPYYHFRHVYDLVRHALFIGFITINRLKTPMTLPTTIAWFATASSTVFIH